jgi:uncharacterized protein YciI
VASVLKKRYIIVIIQIEERLPLIRKLLYFSIRKKNRRMKKNILFILLTTLSLGTFAQSGNPKYNKALADSLGADDYGMKMYTLVILKTGPANITRKETVDSLFGGHMQNINRLVGTGQLVVAGPLAKNDKSYRGIFILNVKTIEEARNLLATDPAVKSGLLDADVFQWYGSAALPLYLKEYEKLEKKKM